MTSHEPSADELARRALARRVTDLADRLHNCIDEGIDDERLHDVVGLWWANVEHLSFADLVDEAQPSTCADCETDVTPYDLEDHRPVEAGWEWYMVTDEVWDAALRAGSAQQDVHYLCVGCLEQRISRPLRPEDFADIGVNDESWLMSQRLRDRLRSG